MFKGLIGTHIVVLSRRPQVELHVPWSDLLILTDLCHYVYESLLRGLGLLHLLKHATKILNGG